MTEKCSEVVMSGGTQSALCCVLMSPKRRVRAVRSKYTSYYIPIYNCSTLIATLTL